MTTPLEEARKAHLEHLHQSKDLAGGPGALARLGLATGTSAVFSEWLHAEFKRGTEPEEITGAFCTYLGNVVFNFGMSFPDGPMQMIGCVLGGIEQVMAAYLSGERPATGIQMNEDGHQREVTIAGMVAELKANGGRLRG